SLLFSLSDPSNPQFAVVPSHHHKYQCPRCVHIEKTFREMSDILSSIQISDPSDEIKELIFKLNNHRDLITQGSCATLCIHRASTPDHH
ncbi:hypothetical protein PMAYCL1PPCAC_05873, partial [Pristionchus mayeri]